MKIVQWVLTFFLVLFALLNAWFYDVQKEKLSSLEKIVEQGILARGGVSIACWGVCTEEDYPLIQRVRALEKSIKHFEDYLEVEYFYEEVVEKEGYRRK